MHVAGRGHAAKQTFTRHSIVVIIANGMFTLARTVAPRRTILRLAATGVDRDFGRDVRQMRDSRAPEERAAEKPEDRTCERRPKARRLTGAPTKKDLALATTPPRARSRDAERWRGDPPPATSRHEEEARISRSTRRRSSIDSFSVRVRPTPPLSCKPPHVATPPRQGGCRD